jgi:UDP-3-O-[3-hydroxymyristoyl] N-acetylglucosamine deacetylase
MEKRTLRRDVRFSGVGVHSGQEVSLRLAPSSSGEIVFRRTDLGNLEVRIDPESVEARNSSVLVAPQCRIRTIEHLMATLFIFGIDSLTIELDGDEIPALDGSAVPFAEAVQEAGVRPVEGRKRSIRILEQITIYEKGASILCYPDSDFRVSYFIEYPHPAVGHQELSLAMTLESFVSEIAPARTFGFLKDVESLNRQGLALGGSLENAIVLDDVAVLNPPLRFPDEFVRHKILDLIGDFSLLGHPLIGHFRAYKAGHALHLRTVRYLLDNPDFWEFEEDAFPSYLK